jgi:hypothetical protein
LVAISFCRPRKKLVLIMLNGSPHACNAGEVARDATLLLNP